MTNNKPSTGKEKRLQTLAAETEKKKKDIVAQLRKTPIVQVACERVGIGRSTYYKSRAEDLIFARAADSALDSGKFFINDLAESKLIKMMQNDSLTAIIFWLKHNHPQYANRIINEFEVSTTRPSVEERNHAIQEIGKIMAKRYAPRFSVEEIKEKVEEELEEAEQEEKLRKKLELYEDNFGADKLST